MNKLIIKLENVWKTYKMGNVEVNALQGLSLDIKEGEFLAIMGPSGSGKSSTVNMIGCLDVPSRGKIMLDNHDISKLSESELARIRGRKIGFIFQQFNLIPTLTALENVILPMIFQGVEEEERMKRANQLLELVGLKDRIYHKPTKLSGGEQQRVAIARALSNNPDVIIADEPTGNLDSKTGANIMNFLQGLHEKDKKTIVMVTHDTGISKIADRTEFLKDGKIIKSVNNHR